MKLDFLAFGTLNCHQKNHKIKKIKTSFIKHLTYNIEFSRTEMTSDLQTETENTSCDLNSQEDHVHPARVFQATT